MKQLLALMLLAVTCLCRAAPPTIVIDLDVQRTEAQQALNILQASTPVVEFRILQRGQPVAGLADYTANLKYGTTLTPTAGWVSVDSASTDGVNSKFRFEFDQADTNTNGVFQAVVQVLDGSGGLYYSGRLRLSIVASTANTGADTLDLGTTVDWAGTTYSNGVASGPYSAGTNITFAAGSGGKVVVNSKVVGTAAAGRLLYGDADGTWKALAAGSSGQVLQSNGAAAPSWSAAGTGDISGVTAGTGLSGGGASGDVTLSLANTAVTAGSYNFASITVDAQGRLTAASTGTPVPDGDKGDITVSSGSWSIDAGAVTLAKQANLAQATVIGRESGAGTGTPTALSAAQVATIVQGASVFLPLAGGTLSGSLTANAGANVNNLLTVNDGGINIQEGSGGVDATTLGELRFWDYEGTEGEYARIAALRHNGSQGKLIFSTSDNSGVMQQNFVLGPGSGAVLTGTMSASGFSGSGASLTGLPATELTGDIPAASFGAVEIEATDRDFHLYTVEDVGWALAYVTTNAMIDCVKSANTSEQDALLHSDLMRTPRGFTAYATSGALVIDWAADSTTLADIRGIRLLGYTAPGATPVVVYSDTTTRNVTSALTSSAVNAAQISINASSFTTSTIYAFYRIEISATVEDGFCLAILNARVVSQ